MLSQPQQNGVVLSPDQIAERKRKQEDEQRAKTKDFRLKKEALMKEIGVIEVAIVKYDPMSGITPDSVVLPYTWKEGETFLSVPSKDVKKDGKKQTSKTK